MRPPQLAASFFRRFSFNGILFALPSTTSPTRSLSSPTDWDVLFLVLRLEASVQIPFAQCAAPPVAPRSHIRGAARIRPEAAQAEFGSVLNRRKRAGWRDCNPERSWPMKLFLSAVAALALAILALSVPAPVVSSDAVASRMNGKGECSEGSNCMSARYKAAMTKSKTKARTKTP